jgi:polyisoprenyl-teichoic acid--peptidoglycan teichoic acid transferase
MTRRRHDLDKWMGGKQAKQLAAGVPGGARNRDSYTHALDCIIMQEQFTACSMPRLTRQANVFPADCLEFDAMSEDSPDPSKSDDTTAMSETAAGTPAAPPPVVRAAVAVPPVAEPPAAKRRKSPLWAKLTIALGLLLLIGSGGSLLAAQALIARYTAPIHQQHLLPTEAAATNNGSLPAGPLNILLIGIDTRASTKNEPARSDTIMIVHVTDDHRGAYLVSIPRDLYVAIPAGEHNNATHDKINSAYAWGSTGRTGDDAVQGGANLLTSTISQDFGIKFDAVAVIDFEGFREAVSVLGGVYMCVDEDANSQLRGTNKYTGKFESPYYPGGNVLNPNVTPVHYAKGCRRMSAVEALDYVRIRHGLPDNDYGRQRHQQQFIKAVLKEATAQGMLASPTKLDGVIRAIGGSLHFDGNGISPVDWMWALKNITTSEITMLKTAGTGLYSGKTYLGEQLMPDGVAVLRALKDNQLDTFAMEHQNEISSDGSPQ